MNNFLWIFLKKLNFCALLEYYAATRRRVTSQKSADVIIIAAEA
jgi:hypothetical protein